jgi:integrase/recombinase XerD
MGTLHKLNGRWVVDYRLPRYLARKYGCDRFRRSYSKKAMARKVHAMVSAAITLRDPDGVLASLLNKTEDKYTVESFYRRWIEKYCTPRLTPSTVKRYKLSFVSINDFCGKSALSEIGRQDLDDFIQSRKGKVSDSTINKDLIAFKGMMTYAVRVGAIPASPLNLFPILRVQEKPRRIPTQEEFHALVKAMPDPAIAAMVAVMGEAGIRRSEAINLEWKNVDLRNAEIVLEKTKGKRVRHVPLSSMALSHLRGLSRFVHTPFVFCHQVSGKRWTSPDKSFRSGREKAKLDWVTFHTLRHMFGTRIVKMGVDIESAKELLGHDDIKTTDRYAKHAKSDAVEALREAQKLEVEGQKRDRKNGPK